MSRIAKLFSSHRPLHSLWARIGSATLLSWGSAVYAEAPAKVQRHQPEPAFSVVSAENLEAIPRLRHRQDKRWPLILWQAGDFDPHSVDYYHELLSRGVTQHIPLDDSMIATARALQQAGSPVIMMEGKSGPFPYSLAGDQSQWAHRLDAGYTPTQEVHACPEMVEGWQIEADRIRATLQRFKDAGITVNAVWLDWEVQPGILDAEDFQQAKHCARCRATLPHGVLDSVDKLGDYGRRKFVELIGAYVAAPAREIFPNCSVTNWGEVVAAPQHVLQDWYNNSFVPRVPSLVTATEPVAYGMTNFFDHWQRRWQLDREHVDQLYTHLLLRQVSNETANRLTFAPHLQSIPWVARWCTDDPEPDDARPIMSRERYREVLRHLWLRGISGMQVFNPIRPGYEEMSLYEVQDAVAVYDETLVYGDLLDAGEPMNLKVPRIQDNGVIWSGLRTADRAVVRAFKQGGGARNILIKPWATKPISLTATSQGRTYLLERQKDGTVSKTEIPNR